MAGPEPLWSGALRRVVLAGLAYGALVLVLGLPLSRAMDAAFLLPPMFVPLVRGLFVVIGLVVLLAAWRYPELGDGPDAGGSGGPPQPPSGRADPQ